MLAAVENKFLSLRQLLFMIETLSLFSTDSRKSNHLMNMYKLSFTMLGILIHLLFLDQDFKDLSEASLNLGSKLQIALEIQKQFEDMLKSMKALCTR